MWNTTESVCFHIPTYFSRLTVYDYRMGTIWEPSLGSFCGRADLTSRVSSQVRRASGLARRSSRRVRRASRGETEVAARPEPPDPWASPETRASGDRPDPRWVRGWLWQSAHTVGTVTGPNWSKVAFAEIVSLSIIDFHQNVVMAFNLCELPVLHILSGSKKYTFRIHSFSYHMLILSI